MEILVKLIPCLGQPFLVELLQLGVIAFPGSGLGSEVKLSQHAPAHRGERIPMEAHILRGCIRILRDKA